jgi:hypothetical protein
MRAGFHRRFVIEWSAKRLGVAVNLRKLYFPMDPKLGRCIAVRNRCGSSCGDGVEQGEELVRIPHAAMLQSCDLSDEDGASAIRNMWSRNGQTLLSASTDFLGVQESGGTDDDVEHWLLATLLAVERSRGTNSRFYPYLRHCLRVPAARSWTCSRSGLAVVPSRLCRSVLPDLEEKEAQEVLRRAVREEQRRQLQVARALLTAIQPLKSSTGKIVVSAEDLCWGYRRVVSRAHLFSTAANCFSPREYPLTSNTLRHTTPKGCERFMCVTLPPFFDLINHGPTTNVIFVDVPSHNSSIGASEKNRDLVIAARHRLEPGAVLVMQYRPVMASRKAGESSLASPTVDRVRTFLRFGFIPE